MNNPKVPISICLLGRQPVLGIAELESLYGADAVTTAAPQAAGLELAANAIDFDRLGGSTRLAKVVSEVPGTNWKNVEKELAKIVPELTANLSEGKIQLGLSAIGMPITPAKLNAAGLSLKKILRAKTGRSARVTPNPELLLNTAQVQHNHLTGPTGVEILILATSHGNTLIAQTTAVQDINSYTKRDRGRPKRDAKVGMLPPKLAQIIINLAAGQTRPAADKIILDPFCGTGVILQEALLAGFSAYGTDLEPRMIDYTGENLDWLDTEFNVPVGATCRFEQGDATAYQWEPDAHIVASETYLGRPFTSKPTPEIFEKTASEVNHILKKYLHNIHAQLAPGDRLCLAVPAWIVAPGKFRHLPLVDQLSDLGYNRVSFEHVRDEDLLYYREDQITARELLVLTRK